MFCNGGARLIGIENSEVFLRTYDNYVRVINSPV